jgi:hypothetical protein
METETIITKPTTPIKTHKGEWFQNAGQDNKKDDTLCHRQITPYRPDIQNQYFLRLRKRITAYAAYSIQVT